MNAKLKLKRLFANRDKGSIALELYGFTGFRTGKLDELTTEEAKALLEIHRPRKNSELRLMQVQQEAELKEYKSKILAIAESEGIKKADSWEEFNHFMLHSSRFKKHLNAHNLDELKLLLKQMVSLQINNRRSAEKPMTKAWIRHNEKLKMWN